MLNVFRNNLKRFAPILWIVIAVFVLLVFTDYSNNDRVGSSADTAATVGDYDISFAEVQNSYSALEQQFRGAYGEVFDQLKDQLNLPVQAVNRVVANKIQREDAAALGLGATSGELRERILLDPAFQNETGGFVGEDEYRRILQRNRLSVDEFETRQREFLVENKFRTILADTAWVSDSDLEQSARDDAERAKVRYVSLDGSTLADEVEVSDADIATYFDENQSDYELPERRRAAYLSVNVNSVRAELDIPDEEVRAYFDANPGEFTQEEQVRARHILLFVNEERTADQARAELEAIKARVAAGEDFGAIAQQVSEDEASKPQGGDLGFFPRGRMTQPFELAAFGGSQGEIVGPIENQLGARTGFHLIEIIARRDGGVQPYEEVSNRILVRMLNERARTEAENRAQALSTRVAGSPPVGEEALRALAEEEGVALEILEPFALTDNLPGLGRSTQLATALFDAETGALTEPIELASGWALGQVLEVQEPRIPALDEVRDDVRGALVAERQNDLAEERLAAVQTRLAAEELTFDEAAEELGLDVQESSEFGALESFAAVPGVDDLAEAALALDTGDIGGPLRSVTGAMIFEVSERKRFDPVAFAASKNTTSEQERANRTATIVGSWIQTKLEDLDVRFTPQMIEMFDLGGQLGDS
ncbi:MAG: peptidylprolyl isomerase [Acidobacteriota bacterium]